MFIIYCTKNDKRILVSTNCFKKSIAMYMYCRRNPALQAAWVRTPPALQSRTWGTVFFRRKRCNYLAVFFFYFSFRTEKKSPLRGDLPRFFFRRFAAIYPEECDLDARIKISTQSLTELTSHTLNIMKELVCRAQRENFVILKVVPMIFALELTLFEQQN